MQATKTRPELEGVAEDGYTPESSYERQSPTYVGGVS